MQDLLLTLIHISNSMAQLKITYFTTKIFSFLWLHCLRHINLYLLTPSSFPSSLPKFSDPRAVSNSFKAKMWQHCCSCFCCFYCLRKIIHFCNCFILNYMYGLHANAERRPSYVRPSVGNDYSCNQNQDGAKSSLKHLYLQVQLQLCTSTWYTF